MHLKIYFFGKLDSFGKFPIVLDSLPEIIQNYPIGLDNRKPESYPKIFWNVQRSGNTTGRFISYGSNRLYIHWYSKLFGQVVAFIL